MNNRLMQATIRMTRAGFAIAASLLATGCLTTRSDRTTILVNPPDAEILIAGFGACTSPCVVQHDRRRSVSVARAGYLSQKFDISPGAGTVRVEMVLAAPTEGVQTQELPEL